MSNSEKDEKLAVVYQAGKEEIRLTPNIVQQFIVGSDSPITLQEYKYFTSLCKARGLNPFLKEAYCVKYGNNPAQIVVGKDAVIKRAVLNPAFDGIESGVIVQNRETGEIIERKGTFYLNAKEELVGGWAKVYRKDWNHQTYSSVSFDEVAQRKKDGTLNSNWQGKGATMVEKVAKVRALRETFVEDLSGMYDADEIDDEQPQEKPKKAANSGEYIDVMPVNVDKSTGEVIGNTPAPSYAPAEFEELPPLE